MLPARHRARAAGGRTRRWRWFDRRTESPAQQALDLLQTTGREESVAPQLFEEANRVQPTVLVPCGLDAANTRFAPELRPLPRRGRDAAGRSVSSPASAGERTPSLRPDRRPRVLEAALNEQVGIWRAMIVVLDSGEHCPHHFRGRTPQGAKVSMTRDVPAVQSLMSRTRRLNSVVQRRVLRMNRLPASNRGNSLQL